MLNKKIIYFDNIYNLIREINDRISQCIFIYKIWLEECINFKKKVLKLRLGIISILKIGISHATNNIVIPFLSVFFGQINNYDCMLRIVLKLLLEIRNALFWCASIIGVVQVAHHVTKTISHRAVPPHSPRDKVQQNLKNCMAKSLSSSLSRISPSVSVQFVQ